MVSIEKIQSKSENFTKSLICFFTVFAVSTSSIAFARDFSEVECPIIGNTESNIFHVKGCPNYEQMLAKNKKSDNRRCFESRRQALEEGYRISKNCRKGVR